MPGINPLTFPTDAAHAAYDVETSSGDTVTHEPPLACYVTASCPAGRRTTGPGVPVGCADPRHLVFALHAPRGTRIVAVRVYVDGRLVKRARGHSLHSVSLRGLPARGKHSIRIVTTASNGSLRTTVHRYRGC
jgi:hypothetical protein